jgi:hypothetical protein
MAERWITIAFGPEESSSIQLTDAASPGKVLSTLT